MVHMSKFSAQAPINVALFDEQLAALVNFDLIPTDGFFMSLGLGKPDLEPEATEEEIEDEELELDYEQGRIL